MGRRLIAVLLLAAMICFLMPGTAFADADAAFVYDAYVGLRGKTVRVAFRLSKSATADTYLLLGGDGQTIAKRSGCKPNSNLEFVFKATGGWPAGQTVSLWADGAQKASDTALLAIDSKDNFALRGVRTKEKVIAFTINSAGGVSNTKLLLNILDEYNVTCTFFLQGSYAASHPEITREISERGHEVGSHSYAHPDMNTTSVRKIYKDLTRAMDAIEKATGKPVTLYRPPAGISSYNDRALSRALGCSVVQWTVDSHDGFSDATYHKVVGRVKRYGTEGSIVQFHVYGQYTPSALKVLIPYYLELGYRFVTVSELLSLLSGPTRLDEENFLTPVIPRLPAPNFRPCLVSLPG